MYQCLDCRHVFEIEMADKSYNYDDESFDCCPKCGGEELIKINEDP